MAVQTLLQKIKETSPTTYAAIIALLVGGGTTYTNLTNTSKSDPKVSPTPIIKEADIEQRFLNASPEVRLAISSKISPTLSQRDNFTMPHRTCNSTSNAMLLNFYRSFIGKPQVEDDVYLASVLKRGDTIYHEVQTASLDAYGLNTVWNIDKNLSRIKAILKNGYPVVVNILHRGSVTQGTLRGGHIIVLRSYDEKTKQFAVSDPYGLLESDYKDFSKFTYSMSENIFSKRWQSGYRTISNAQADKFGIARQ
jgi:uncharacterized protein YvpB